jgi:hypothetical protein
MILFDGAIQLIRLKGNEQRESLGWGCRPPRALLHARDDAQLKGKGDSGGSSERLFKYRGEQLESKP